MPQRTVAVLLVEDEKLIRWWLAEMLSARGYTVLQAEDGASAVRLLEQQSPIDVVLLDFHLPDSTGLDRFHEIRALAPSVAVVMMTGLGDDDWIPEALATGAHDVLVKPFGLSVLERALTDAVSRLEGPTPDPLPHS